LHRKPSPPALLTPQWRHEAVDEGDEPGLARDAALGEDTAQMRLRRRLRDAQRGCRLDQAHAAQQPLEHACLCRREPEGGGHGINSSWRRLLDTGDEDSSRGLRHESCAEIAAANASTWATAGSPGSSACGIAMPVAQMPDWLRRARSIALASSAPAHWTTCCEPAV
jgi:hypothetical protein